MPTEPLKPGDPVRLGRFEILARLGQGGQGVVYLGRGDGPGEERVAIKVPRVGADAMALERLSRELDAIHQVQPFVTAGIIDVAADGERWFVASEYIDGPSVQDRVDNLGPLSGGELHRLAVGTATALAAIHGAGVVHRDFKPANVLLGPDGPRVVDFGIARLSDAATITSGVIGTPSYMAPEQLSGERPGSAVDIFAWAVTIVFAATGRPAFNADSIPAVMHRILFEEPDLSGVPPALRPLVGECLSKEPGLRPSARDLLLRLVDPSATASGANLVGAHGTGIQDTWRDPVEPAWPVGRPGEPMVPAGRGKPSRTPLLIGGGAVVVAALVAAGFLLFPDGSSPQASGPPSTVSQSTASPPVTGLDDRSTAAADPPASVAATGPTIPAAYAGTWNGTATMAEVGMSGIGLKSGITFTFTTGARTVHEVNDACDNTLTLSKVAGSQLVFTEPGTPDCVAGTVTFQLRGGKLDYRWSDNKSVENTALLTRS